MKTKSIALVVVVLGLMLLGTRASAQVQVAGQLLIDLHVQRGLVTSDGAVTAWTNYGAVGGVFTNDGAADTWPVSGVVLGQPAVSFDGNDRLRASFMAPAEVTGQADDYTVEYWVLNPVIANEEWILTWARRGTTARYAGFGYGTNTAFGVTAHWGGTDMGFGEGVSIAGIVSTPPSNQWHHIVVTYDGLWERAYVNGVLNAQEMKLLNIWDGDPVTLGSTYTYSPPTLTYSSGINFSGSLLALRVHSSALTAAQVASNYLAGMSAGVAIVAKPPTGIGPTGATFNGELLPAGAPATVWVFYGPSDGCANKGAWAASALVGEGPAGPLSVAVSDLAPGRTYWARFYASNALAEAWSASVSLNTLSISTLPAKAVTVTSAYTRGQLVATNGVPTRVRVFWGLSDGGTDLGSWSGMVDLGIRPEGEVLAPLTGLMANTPYFYRYHASNELGQTWAPTSASFRTRAVFDPTGLNFTAPITFTGYTDTEPLLNFPALVVFHPGIPGFDYGQIFSEGADLRFTSDDGAELAFEIETWNPAGTSFVWVQVPALTPGTSIHAFWGQGGASLPAYASDGSTWSDGFAGVWHMTNKYVKDSSGNGFHATYVNTPAAVSDAVGIIGGAQDYNAAVGNAFTTVGVINFTNMTLSAWVWLRTPSRDGLFMCKDGTPALGLGDIYFWQQGATLRFETFLWGLDTTVPVANVGGVGQWVHVAATVSGTRQSFYTNGVLVASWDKNPVGQNANQFQIGGSFKQSGRRHDGRLDECRAEWVARSAAWIRACHDNQRSPTTFQTFGTIRRLTNPLMVGRPIVTDIQSTSASILAYVNGDGGHGITSWGTLWDATPEPLANPLGVTGQASAPLAISQTRADFSPGARVFVRAYASNAVDGIRYSPDTEFYLEPLEATDLVFSAVEATSLTLSWTPGVGSAGSLVLMREGNPVTAVPADGMTYAASAHFELGADLGGGTYAVYAGPGNTVTVRGLLPGVTYHVAVYAYSGSGPLINYQDDMPASEFQRTATATAPGLQVAGVLLIDLSAGRGVQFNEAGQVTNWVNFGAVGGSFQVDGLPFSWPTYGSVQDQICVTFDGTDHLKGTMTAPAQITGLDAAGRPDDFSLEMWVLNPVIANEEWVFAWGRRGTTPRCAAFGYGTNASFGVMGHWAAADLAFGEGVGTPGIVSTPPAGQWHHIVATYDGTIQRVYVNGVLNAQETKALDIWDGGPCILGDQFWDLPFSYSGLKFSGALAALRVHSRALTAEQVVSNYNLGLPVPADPVVILGQPKSRLAAQFGATRLSVTAVGAPPLSYQWYRGQEPIPGATSSTLLLSNLTLADNGAQLRCVASNYIAPNAYTATSAVATLTVLPPTASLRHRYTFDTDASDSVGGAHGVLRNGAAISSGAVTLSGGAQYVDLPNGLVAGYDNITVEAWLVDHGSGAWARIWDFGNSSAGEDFPIAAGPVGTQYMFISPRSGLGTLRGAYTVTGGGAGEQLLEWAGTPLPVGVLKQVVWTSDEALQTGVLYVDGVPVATNLNMTLTPASLGVTVNNWLGRSQFGVDAFLNGRIFELRIYNVALPVCRVRQSFLLGPDTPLDDRTVVVLSVPQDRTNNVGTTATFSIGVAACEPVVFQWYHDGVDLIDETNATLVLPDVQVFSAGTYEVVITDAFGQEITRAAASLTVNRLPGASDDLLGAARDVPVSFPAEQLTANDSDADGDPLTVMAVSPTSAQGGAVGLAAGHITYSPPAGFTGSDSFTYTVSDGRGGTATATVNVSVVVVTHRLEASLQAGVPAFSFSGIPYRTYRILASEDLVNWAEFTTVTANAQGEIAFQDTTTPAPPQRFFKAVWP